jgi:hypothetical protein
LVHGSLDLPATAYMIANESNRILGSDRVSVLVRRGPRYEVVAVSGVDTVRRRANAVRRLELLVRTALRWDEPLRYPEDASELPPEIESALNAYLDESHSRTLRLVRLPAEASDQPQPTEPWGALVVECFDAREPGPLDSGIQLLGEQAAHALRNAVDHDRMPLRAISRAIRAAGWYTRAEQLPRTLVVAASVLVAVLALSVIPADFTIRSRGELQPQNRFHVFAPVDGVIVSLQNEPGGVVRSGDVLAVLRSPQLDLQFTEVVGRRRTVEEQLSTVLAARLRGDPADDRANDPASLSAQEEQLREELDALDKQYQILIDQQKELKIRSPADGTVLTWDIARTLAQRPVNRGDRLMTVADLDGPWEVALGIDDAEAGHVLAAQANNARNLPVSFILVGQSGTRFAGRLREIHTSTEVDDEGRAVVPAWVELDDGNVPEARPGARVDAKIDCGQRPLGYVWFRGLWEVIRSQILF